jgi:Flp pilus assembly protein TadD
MTRLSLPQALALAEQHLRQGQDPQALAIYQQILLQAPAIVAAALGAARLLLRHRQHSAALQILDTALQSGAQDYQLAYLTGALRHQAGNHEGASAAAVKAIALQPDSAPSHNLYGISLVERGQYDAAERAYLRAIALDPRSPDAHNNLAWLYRAQGKREPAAEQFMLALARDPEATESLGGLLMLLGGAVPDQHIAQAESRLADTALPVRQKCDLAFALGKVFEERRQYRRAFAQFETGNRLYAGTLNYTAEAERSFFEALLAEQEVLEVDPTPDHPYPIFIVGMPRSGTSLVEQILASHTQVAAAGELHYLERACLPQGRPAIRGQATAIARDYQTRMAKLAGGKPFVTDKMPLNFRFIGLICQAFPGARIIHCQRDPMDTCWSVFKHHFPMTHHPYAYDQATLGHYFTLYRDMMETWAQRFAGRIIQLSYEALIDDFEPGVRRLLEALGLEFEAGCLRFHETSRPVRTASSEQVRRPLFSGKDQWRHYEQELAPLKRALAAEHGVRQKDD